MENLASNTSGDLGLSTSNSAHETSQNNNRATETTQNNDLPTDNRVSLPTATSPNSTLIKKHLLDQMPKIAPKDFIGKDLCPKCSKVVKESHQAVSCDGCDLWTHRKCCQIKVKKYKRLCGEKFAWLCINCRSDDDLTDELINIETLDENDLPDDYAIVKKQHNKELLILHINCRSLVNKLEELQFIIDILNPDIICLTETWFDCSIPPNSHIPVGFKIIRKDRSPEFQQKYKKNRGGGVAILYRSHLTVITKEKLCNNSEEMLWVQVRGKESFLLGVIYRPDYSDLLNLQQSSSDVLNDDSGESPIEKNIRAATEISRNIIITGDFNVDMKNIENSNTQILKNIYKSYSLSQKIVKPTRINYNTGKSTIIDHIWSTPELKIKSSGTFMGLSDHLGVYTKINMTSNNTPPAQYVKRRCFKSYDPIKYSQEVQENLNNSDIPQHIANKDINAATESLTNILLRIAEKHAPFKNFKIKEKSRIPWTTPELTNMIAEKNQLLSANSLIRSKILKRKINKTQNTIKNLKKSLKKDFTKKEIDKAGKDPQKLWYLYNLLTQRGKQKDLIEPENMSQESANKYNHYFSTIGHSRHINVPTSEVKSSTVKNCQFSLKHETPQTIDKIIDSLKNRVAVGRDNLHVCFIKDAKKEISSVITSIINLGFDINIFPTSMKISRIKPIYKKENPNKIENYRPIALLPILSKIIERCVANQIIDYLEQNHLLSKSQHAYRKQHSPITCLAEILNLVYKKLDSNIHTAIVSVDLSKAFDSINHRILLKKLQKLGFQSNALKWISSYLDNRRHTTQFKHFESTEAVATTGVPQGSILGPLLFICYTNDLSDSFGDLCSIFSYADDTQFVASAPTQEDLQTKIKDIITQAEKWFSINHLQTNPTKTKILIFNYNKENPVSFEATVFGKSKKIFPKPHVKILGVYVDKDLNWVKHINHVKKKSMNVTRNIHRINYLLPIQHRINLYHGVISPQFEYADVAWGGCAEKDKKRLQTVQNFAAKSITGNRKKDSATQSLKKLNFLNLQQRRQVHDSVFAHKALLEKSTANLHSQYASLIPKHKTRRSTLGKLNLPAHSTTKYKKSPFLRSIIAWNDTPPTLPKDNIKSHKTGYQNHLLAKTHLQN